MKRTIALSVLSIIDNLVVKYQEASVIVGYETIESSIVSFKEDCH